MKNKIGKALYHILEKALVVAVLGLTYAVSTWFLGFIGIFV